MLNELLIGKFQFFLLIMMRMFGMVAVAPFFSSAIIPMRIKVVLTLGITIVIFPILSTKVPIQIPHGIFDYFFLIGNELIVGLTIGLLLSIIFAAFQLAGEFFSIQMGLGISEVFDPMSQIHVPLIGQFLTLLGTLIFILTKGHLLLIEGVYQSYMSVPQLDLIKSSGTLSKSMIDVFVNMFSIALKISLPIMGTLFIVTLCMGLLAKFAPQMNILMLGFPVYITIGFIMLILLLPYIVENGNYIIEKYLEQIFHLF
ncbi:MAG: flagellar biosynthetic protein FliR [Spirochaetota bacterium]|nr:flagellar biosynthetic protein FliR [Spirochaetota bacterium]